MSEKLQLMVHRVGDVLRGREIRKSPFRHALAQRRGHLAADLRIDILMLDRVADGGDALLDLRERQRLRDRRSADQQRTDADEETSEKKAGPQMLKS